MGRVGETPAVARDLDPRSPLVVAHGQDRVRVGRSVHDLVAPAVPPGQGLGDAPLVDHDLGRDPTRDGLAAVGGDRQVDLEAAVAREHVPVPGAPDEGVALAEEEAVAPVLDGGGVVAARGAVEARQHAEVAPIVHLVQQPVVPLRRVDGLQQDEVAREGHAAARVARGAPQVHDAGVRGARGVDGVVEPAAHLLVRAHRPEGLPAREGLARAHLDADDLGRGGDRREQE